MTDTETNAETTDLITIPHKTDVPALFAKEGGIAELVEKITKQAKSFAIDISTAKGRKEVKSLAAKVSRSKTLIDEVGKEQNEERNRLNKEVNAQRTYAKDRLDALRDEIKAPVDKWEAAEADRVRQLLIRMDAFDLEQSDAHADTATIQGRLDAIEGTVIDETWQEKKSDAKAAKAAALVKYQADLAIAKSREASEAELEALRAEKAQRDQEAAERAIAEQKARTEAEAAAKAEAEKAAAVEAERIANARAAERDRIEREAELEAMKRQAEEDLAEAKRQFELDAKEERERIAAAKKTEEGAANARAADKKHRQKIRKEIVDAITAAQPGNWEELVDMMIVGEIAHVKVMI